MPVNIYQDLAFPWVLKSASGKIVEEGDGTLFQVENRAVTGTSLDFIRSITRPGWFVDPNGWAIFCVQTIDNELLVLPGLKIFGVSKISSKSGVLSAKFQKEHIERHVGMVLDSSAGRLDEQSQQIRSLIHEIRRINAAIINASEELGGTGNPAPERRADLVKNINALSQLLSARMDAQDVLSAFNSVEDQPKERIPVYKKFDKLVKCHKATAQIQKVRINLHGNCHEFTYGPNLFEIVPFLLIENAIKYAPRGTDIVCTVEQKSEIIECSVESLGPKIHAHEIEKIFLSGYRGEAARKSAVTGDGLGLYVLKKTIETMYEGSITVIPGVDMVVENNTTFYRNKFVCKFPIDHAEGRRPRAIPIYRAA